MRVRPTDDLGPARWLVESVTEFGGRVDQLLPPGFPGCVRLFHRPDQGLADDGSAATWAAVAARHGTVLHSEAQWRSLTGGRVDSPQHPGPDASTDQPREGSLDRLTLPRLTEHLARHTTTPEVCHTALWVGFGSAPRSWEGLPTFRTPAREYWLFPPAPVRSVPERSVDFEVAGIEEQSREPGGVRGLMSIGRVPTRRSSDAWLEHVLAAGDLQSPSWWWPGDRAWVVHSEIDYDSTLVAGQAGLIADLLADPELECLAVRPDTPLYVNADRINGSA
jgi:hypothetical protein